LSYYTSGSKRRYVISGTSPNFTYRLAQLNETNPGVLVWDYFTTDRESVLNDFYHGYYADSFQTQPSTNSRNATQWFDEYDVSTESAPNYKDLIVRLQNLVVKKDQGEKISFSYQFNYISKDSRIFFGDFARQNQIYASHSNEELYCYISTQSKYKTGDTKVKGDSLETSWQFTRTTTSDYVKISLHYNLANYQLAGGTLPSPTQQQIDDYLLANVKSWGIGTLDGKLYVGVNPNEVKTDVYIYASHVV
jgi:hypothetical protein